MFVHELIYQGKPDSLAIVDHERRITYRELQQHVAACRDRLYAAGVRVGDRVIVRLEEVDLENRRMSFVLESNLERRLIKGGKGGSRRSSRRGSRLYGRKFDPFDIDDDDFDELFGQEGDDDWDD